jgi:pimeloyl-ACP methyl ester carboxylesterase
MLRLMKLLRLGLVSALAVAAVKVLGDRAVDRHERLHPQECDAPGKRLEVAGLDLHYEEAGQGEPVVLLHGLGASTFCYRFLVEALAPRYRALALDLPGFGYSTREAEDMSLTAQVENLRGFLDALSIERAALIGHSMGGAILQRFAVTYPARVERLVLISPASLRDMGRAQGLAFLARPFVGPFAAAVFHKPAIRRRWLAFAVHDSAFLTPDLMRQYGLTSRVRGNVRSLQRFLTDRAKDVPFDPSDIQRPTLIIWGGSDRLLPPSGGRRLQERIQGSRFVVVPEAGHLVAEERPEVVNRLVLDFLSESQVPARPGSNREDPFESSEGESRSSGRAGAA